ncbi:MAG: DUF2541 family protein [Saprospiraceae bacterium]|nr:DUF2541 family protein [Saprospiraceae bacterium]
MKNQLSKNLYSLGFILLLSSFTQMTKQTLVKDWELLGSRTVNFSSDRDEIMVTASEGVFKAVMLKVKKSPINMQKMVIHFADGSEQNVEIKNNFRAGGQSRIIDLEGNNRIIRKVVLWYDTKNFKNRRAVVELWGRH